MNKNIGKIFVYIGIPVVLLIIVLLPCAVLFQK